MPTLNPPPGLVGEVAQSIYAGAPRPTAEAALIGGLGFIGGIAGNAYNVSGTGLNQYHILIAPTGTGKEAINSGISKAFAALPPELAYAQSYYGPGEIRSDAALLKYLAKSNCFVSVTGEFGLRLKTMTARNAPSHETGLKRVLLDLYGKSGHGNTLQPTIYSDKEKSTEPIVSPSFTMIGESTPERFYEVLDEPMIAEGLLSRFNIFEYTGKRPPLNEGHASARLPDALVRSICEFIGFATQRRHDRKPVNVHFAPEAKALMDEFNAYCDAMIDAPTAREAHRQVWNRAHVKAMKIAATVAVGMDWHNPVIDFHTAQTARDLVDHQTRALIAKFEQGEVGDVAGNETKQQADVIRFIAEYINPREPFERFESYGATRAMHEKGVFTQSYLSRRALSLPAFRFDRIGPTNALKRTIQALIDADEIRELPKSQMANWFNTQARGFQVANLDRLVAAARKK